MTPSRTSFTRVAGGYMEPDGEIDESFNVNFLNLSAAEKEKNLAIAKAVPFAATNVNLRSLRIRGWRRTEENAPVVVRNARVRTEK